jgi:hypothetical protein
VVLLVVRAGRRAGGAAFMALSWDLCASSL